MEPDAYLAIRNQMVDRQLVPRGITDERVLEAMRRVPRHMFVPEDMRYLAYEDSALKIGGGQTISQPYMVAVMTQLLGIGGGEKVLEIGTGSGYQAAVLSELGADVHTIERVAALSMVARENLANAGYGRVHCMVGDGTLGLPAHQPFDRIIFTAGAPGIPAPLKAQLSMGGILLGPVGTSQLQQLVRLRRTPEGFTETHQVPSVFVPLIGEFGWPSSL